MPSGGATSCFQRNLKTWITVLIVVQFCLVLLYLDVTQKDTSPRHVKLQSRATLGHKTATDGDTSLDPTWQPESRGSYVTRNPDEPPDVIVRDIIAHAHHLPQAGVNVIRKGHTNKNEYPSVIRPNEKYTKNDTKWINTNKHNFKDGRKHGHHNKTQHHKWRDTLDVHSHVQKQPRSNLTSILGKSLALARKKQQRMETGRPKGADRPSESQLARQTPHSMHKHQSKQHNEVLKDLPSSTDGQSARGQQSDHQLGQEQNGGANNQQLQFQPVDIAIEQHQIILDNPKEIARNEKGNINLRPPYPPLRSSDSKRFSRFHRMTQGDHSSNSTKSNNVTNPSNAKVKFWKLNLDLSKPQVFQLPAGESLDKYFTNGGVDIKQRVHPSSQDGASSATDSIKGTATSSVNKENQGGAKASFTSHSVGANSHRCFIEGTPEPFSNTSTTFGCLCKRGYHGKHCSIPDIVYYSSGARFVDLVTPRNVSRRVINALAFNVEFELLEARLYELYEVVDVFILLESNISNYGEPKPMRLFERLKQGYLKEFHSKILYLFLDTFPQGGRSDGWIVDQNMRRFIGVEGLKRIVNKKPDDIFIYTDADEIPSREALLFLRLHDGYPEPFGFSLRWSVFGFFWRQLEPTRIYAGCTIAMMRYVFQYDAYQLRSGDYFTKHQPLIAAYMKSGGNVYDWHLGDSSTLAGWHCSWCMPPERIKVKLESAINADFPRWGDFPEKLRVEYIRNLVKSGTWFDDVTKFGELVSWDMDDFYAPKYMLQHIDKYKVLMNLEDA